uniref:(northern house mosquito) hypothetical protein n=1 Tax=Culex pipiens TaxID=7175 RepID=A0A8D8BUF1_CULPI
MIPTTPRYNRKARKTNNKIGDKMQNCKKVTKTNRNRRTSAILSCFKKLYALDSADSSRNRVNLWRINRIISTPVSSPSWADESIVPTDTNSLPATAPPGRSFKVTSGPIVGPTWLQLLRDITSQRER